MAGVVEVAKFSPMGGATTQAIVPTSSHQELTVAPDGYQGGTMDVYNDSTVDVAVVGGAVPVAVFPSASGPVAGHFVIRKQTREKLDWPPNFTKISIIGTGSPTGTVYVTPGLGS